MRQFASSGFRIWNLGREAKVTYTGFCVCALLAVCVTLALYEDTVGRSITAYYAGEAAQAVAEEPRPGPGADPAGGPTFDLPPDGAEERSAPIVVAMPYRKLLEVTHFHLFTVPVFLLIVAHLFMLTGLSPRAKLAWIAGGWVSSVGHVAAPWLVRYGGRGFAPIYAASGAAMALTLSVLTVYPLVVMWTHAPSKDRAT